MTRFSWRLIAQTPADYTDADPLDYDGMKVMVDDLDSQWWLESPDQQKQAIANAFRVALVSPRQNLKWNSIVYQDLLHIPPNESDPDVFEQSIRDRKSKWDQFGQQTLDLVNQQADDPEWIDYGSKVIERYMPGIWGNIRNCAVIGPFIDQLRQAAMEDIGQGGDGRLFRNRVMEMNIQGIGPKITSFVWLLLCPKSSRLATIDVHMMRVLNQDKDSPSNFSDYLTFEDMLDQQRKQMGYNDVSLGAFQWALWDRQRTPGYHQDHSALRPMNPVDWRNIDWAPSYRPPQSKPITIPEGQTSLMPEQPQTEPQEPVESTWKTLSSWSVI